MRAIVPSASRKTTKPNRPPAKALPPPETYGGFTIPSECVPVVDDIVIQDDTPVDSITTEKQMRLLTRSLYASWSAPGEGKPFIVLANVGLFHKWRAQPLVPDVMLSLDVEWPQDLHQKENNTYFTWVVGKPPDVVIEIVSNRKGGEDDLKLRGYARIGIPYYVIFDPEERLGKEMLRLYQLRDRKYEPLTEFWMEGVGLGLVLWQGEFEKISGTWMRWCDRAGQVIPTGEEARDQERQRADEAEIARRAAELRTAEAHQEIERLRAQLERTAGGRPSKQKRG